MRRVRLSSNFIAEFAAMLDEGAEKFGSLVAERTKVRVRRTIEHLARHPVRPADEELGLCVYHVERTPFSLLYDYDINEIRIYIIVYARSDRAAIDLSSIDW
jgi:ParE toxin of type II toxin-antitoxin system, parDE